MGAGSAQRLSIPQVIRCAGQFLEFGLGTET